MDENMSRGYCQLRADSPELSSRREREERGISSPQDKCNCIYLALVMCGVGFLLPYNSFITAVDYYQQKFPGSTIIFDMSLTYICVAFISVILNNLVIEVLSLHARITFGYIFSFLTLLFVALCDIGFEIFSDEFSYTITLIAVGTVAIGCTVQQSSFYGFTSMLPRRYTQAVMTGESAAGLLISINRILTKLLLDDTKINTLIFFGVSIGTVFLCFLAFHVTLRTEFVKFYVSMCGSARLAEDQRGITGNQQLPPEEVSLVDILDGNVSRDSYGVLVIQSPTSPTGGGVQFPAEAQRSPPPSGIAPASCVTQQNEAEIRGQGRAYRSHISYWIGIKRGCRNRYEVAKKVWPYMLAIGCAYFVTLCLFPGIESEVTSCRLHSWMPVILIGIFNLFDFIGKIIASIPYDWPRRKLVLLTCCRIVLVPILMLCAAPRNSPILKAEGWSMGVSVLLGISNGYFGSVPIILAPGKVPDEQKELTGNIMTLSYSLGLTSGSTVAYLLDASLGPHPGLDHCHGYKNNSFSHMNASVILESLRNVANGT